MSDGTSPVAVNKEVMSVGSWLLTLLVLLIPCVGIVMYFVWAFGVGNENRRNFCRAGLIMSLISFALSASLVAAFWATIATLF